MASRSLGSSGLSNPVPAWGIVAALVAGAVAGWALSSRDEVVRTEYTAKTTPAGYYEGLCTEWVSTYLADFEFDTGVRLPETLPDVDLWCFNLLDRLARNEAEWREEENGRNFDAENSR